jgi:hypothetical protein
MTPKQPEKPVIQAGQVAFLATKTGKSGPFYVVQIAGETATLQGLKQFEAPVADLIAG